MVRNIDIVSTKPVNEREELFLPYYLGETAKEAEETYNEFSWLLNIMASNYAKNSSIEIEDLFAEAITGLARAKRDWDSTRGGCTFKTYAIRLIKNSLNECYRKHRSIVNIPHYVRTAHTYITNIKTILEGHGAERHDIEMILEGGAPADMVGVSLPAKDYERLENEINKLRRLIKNSGVSRIDLIRRSEFVPSDMAYDETMTQEDMNNRERQRLAAALLVSKMEDHMTDEELHVARGIMAGHSYAEIGRTYKPKRSIAWVQSKVDEMRDKFKNKLREGL